MEFRFPLPDAGTFWYHPHVDETRQIERGLYGAVVVRDADQPRVDRERVLVVDDVRLDRRGRMARPGRLLERMRGREGDLVLVNGRPRTELVMSAGQVERWRLVNAANARYLRLAMQGRAFTVLGSSGGLHAEPAVVDEWLLVPGDRVDLAVGPFAVGDRFPLTAQAYDRGAGRVRAARVAGVIVGAPQPSVASIPRTLRRIDPLTGADAVPNRVVRLGGRLGLRGVEGLVNGQPHHRDAPVEVGALQVWDIVNETGMDHPFHLHGFFFQVVGSEQPSWRDTVNVPARQRVRIAWLPDDRPGPWMYHCHILEHHAAGMMAHFDVVRGPR